MRPDPVPRNVRFYLDAPDFPKHYMGDNAVYTAACNALHLIFPLGERFFVRSVKKYKDHITDPVLRKNLQNFIAQEGFHGREHEAFFQVMRHHGYNIDTYLKFYAAFAYGFLEKIIPPVLRLSITAALEHFTAALGHSVLTTSLIDDCDDRMRQLFKWHSAEEIEHKAVAFDVLQVVSKSYFIRITGLIFAAFILSFFWQLGTVTFLRQSRVGPVTAFKAARKRIKEKDLRRQLNLHGVFLAYLKPGFHPDDLDDYEIARNFLSTGLPDVAPTPCDTDAISAS